MKLFIFFFKEKEEFKEINQLNNEEVDRNQNFIKSITTYTMNYRILPNTTFMELKNKACKFYGIKEDQKKISIKKRKIDYFESYSLFDENNTPIDKSDHVDKFFQTKTSELNQCLIIIRKKELKENSSFNVVKKKNLKKNTSGRHQNVNIKKYVVDDDEVISEFFKKFPGLKVK